MARNYNKIMLNKESKGVFVFWVLAFEDFRFATTLYCQHFINWTSIKINSIQCKCMQSSSSIAGI